MASQVVAYISPNCPNCVRLVETMKRISSLRQRVKYIDIDSLHPQQVAASGISAVPTLVVQGQMHVGKAAFDYLSQFNEEMEVESISLGGGSLMYGLIDSAGCLQKVEAYGDFVAPP